MPVSEPALLRTARRRIAELQAELAKVKRASALSGEGLLARRKGIFPVAAAMAK